MKRTIVTFLSIAAFLSLLIVVLDQQWQLRKYETSREMAFRVKNPPKLAELSPLEMRALKQWAVSNKLSAEAAFGHRDVRSFSVGQGTCVALLLPRGDIGGSPVYCFNQEHQLVHSFDQIE